MMEPVDKSSRDQKEPSWVRPVDPLHAHFDCFSGAAGDMILAACFDAARDRGDILLNHVDECIRKGLPELDGEFELSKKRVWRGEGRIAATHVSVKSLYNHAPAPVPRSSSPKPKRLGRSGSAKTTLSSSSQTKEVHVAAPPSPSTIKKGKRPDLDNSQSTKASSQHSKRNDGKGSSDGDLSESKGGLRQDELQQEVHSHSHDHQPHLETEFERESSKSDNTQNLDKKQSNSGQSASTYGKVGEKPSAETLTTEKQPTSDHSHEHSHTDDSHEHSHSHGHFHNHSHKDSHEHSHSHSHTHGHSHSHGSSSSSGPLRNLPEIRRMLEEASEAWIPQPVKQRAIQTFNVLAEAEAAVHGAESMDAVHFHEVGAVDSIVDTVGSLLALHALGVESFSCSRLPLGEGTVFTDHGLLPVPAPATLRLMIGMPTTAGPPGIVGELVTPTGAALLRTLAGPTTPATEQRSTQKQKLAARPPQFTLREVGIGAGTKDFGNHPNILRLMIGDTAG